VCEPTGDYADFKDLTLDAWRDFGVNDPETDLPVNLKGILRLFSDVLTSDHCKQQVGFHDTQLNLTKLCKGKHQPCRANATNSEAATVLVLCCLFVDHKRPAMLLEGWHIDRRQRDA
jgi:hypothetical protein